MSSESENDGAGRKAVVDIKLLGPAQEFSPPGVQVIGVPTSTTIAELKVKISQSVPSHPPASCLRLISHGRACRDDERLSEVFARTPSPQDSPFRVLHVVMSDPANPRFPHVTPTASRSSHPPSRSSTPLSPNTSAGTEARYSGHRAPTFPQATRNAATHPQIHTPTDTPAAATGAVHGSIPSNMHHAEMVNGLLNQQFVEQHIAAFQHQIPQLIQQMQGIPMPVMRHGATDRNPVASNIDRREDPLGRPEDTNDSQQAHNLAGTQSHDNVHQSSAGPPQPFVDTHHVAGVDQHGRQFTITVQNQVFATTPHPPPVMLAHAVPVSPASLPHMASPAPGATTQMPQISPIPPFSQPVMGFMPPPALVVPGPIAQDIRPVTIVNNPSDHESDAAHRLLHLSADLYNISRRIQALGGEVAPYAARAHLRPATISDGISHLQIVRDLDQCLQVFDQQCAHARALQPAITSNPQYIQTQARRSGAGAALARIYEMIHAHMLSPTLSSHTSQIENEQVGGASVPMQHTGNQTVSQGDSNGPVTTNTLGAVPSSTADDQIYVLQDPQGAPYAMLVGPSGRHVSQPLPWSILQPMLSGRLGALTLAQAFHHVTNSSYTQTINNVRAFDLPEHRHPMHASSIFRSNIRSLDLNDDGAQPVLAHEQAHPAQHEDTGTQPAAAQPLQEADEMRDVLAPVIRNLWLLVRIAGFAYFLFGGGRALWRPLALAAIMLVVYAAQAGIFGDRFDAMRRYVDRLVGVEPNMQQGPHDQTRAGRTQDATETPATQDAETSGQASETQSSDAEPRPEEAARRLIAQHQQQVELTWFMQQVRYVERMFGLFFASLWPGIGEQAVRLQEERERAIREARQAQSAAAEVAAAEIARQRAEASAEAEAATELAASSSSIEPKQSIALAEGQSTGSEIVSTDGSSVTQVNKGKERAVEQSADA